MRTDSRTLLVALAVFGVVDVLLVVPLSSIRTSPRSTFLAKIAEYFWADQEANIWSWYSSFLLGATGIGLLLLARMQQDGAGRRAYSALGVAAVVMSADETASLHEALGYLGDSIGGLTSHWLLLGVPFAVVAGVVALRLSRRFDPRLRTRLIGAGIVYLLGAVALETVGGALSGPMGLPRFHPLYVLEVTAEEGLEFAGTLMALRAVLAALRSTSTPESSGVTAPRAEQLRSTP
jgi:hypothetical protein